MNTFQESLSSKHFALEIAASVGTRWANRTAFKAWLNRWSPWRDRSRFARALPAVAPLPTISSLTCQYFRSDPAWVAGVFSGPASGSGYAAARAVDVATEPAAAQWRLRVRKARR